MVTQLELPCALPSGSSCWYLGAHGSQWCLACTLLGQFAQVTGATRQLVEQGFCVIIEAAPNSLEPEVLTTWREFVLEVPEMPREVVMRVPEFKALFERLQSEGLDELVWQVVGGIRH